MLQFSIHGKIYGRRGFQAYLQLQSLVANLKITKVTIELCKAQSQKVFARIRQYVTVRGSQSLPSSFLNSTEVTYVHAPVPLCFCLKTIFTFNLLNNNTLGGGVSGSAFWPNISALLPALPERWTGDIG